MQATNQYKQLSNIERKKLTASMAEWLTYVWSSNPGPAKFNPLCLELSCLICFFRSGEFCSYRLGFVCILSLGSFFAKIKLLDGFLRKP